jgi:NitT/TauT family transport system permease protein
MSARVKIALQGVSTQFAAHGTVVRSRRARLATPLGLTLGRTLILLVLIAVWEAASGTLISKFWISSPSAIIAVLGRWIADGSLFHHIAATLTEMGAGYAIGAAAGIGCGLCLGFLPYVERITAPLVAALYALPKIALAPLFVILFGIELESKIVLVPSTIFFLLLYNTLDGVRDIDRDLVEALEVMGATRSEIVRKALVPATLPWIFTGLRIAVRYAFTAAILGELMASNEGIGYLIEASAGDYNTAGVYAAVSVLVAFSVLFTELLTRTEASMLQWRV